MEVSQKKEKQEELLKQQQLKKEAEEKRQRLKQQRAEEKEKEEAERKKKEDEAKAVAEETAASLGVDGTNDAKEDGGEGAPSSKKDVTRSPEHKKKKAAGVKVGEAAPSRRSSKRGAKTTKKKASAGKGDKNVSWTNVRNKKDNTPASSGALFGSSLEAYGGENPQNFAHKHQRVLLTVGTVLSGENKFISYTKKVVDVFELIKIADSTAVLCPITEGEHPKLYESGQVETNLAYLNRHVYTSGDKRNFQMKTVNQDKEGNPIDPYDEDPTVYFSFYVSLNRPVEDVIDDIRLQWYSTGGAKIEEDKFGETKIKQPLLLMVMYNRSSFAVLLHEMNQILEQAREYSSLNTLDLEEADIDDRHPVPSMDIKLTTPRIATQNVKKMQSWPWHMRENRKVLTIQVPASQVKYFLYLHEIAKRNGYYATMWGEHGFVTQPTDNNTDGGVLDRMIVVAQRGISFQLSMKMQTFDKLSDADYRVTSGQGDEEVVLSLRIIFYKLLTVPDGSSFAAEVHYLPGRGLDVVFPHSQEHMEMCKQIKKNPAAFLLYFCTNPKVNIPRDMMLALIRRTCAPEDALKVAECSFNFDTRTLTTKEDRENKKTDEDLEKKHWWKDVNDALGKKKKKESFPDKSMTFDLDNVSTTKTLRREKDNLYKNTTPVRFNIPKQPTINLNSDDDDDGETHVSGFTHVSKSALAKTNDELQDQNDELLELLKANGINVPSNADANAHKTAHEELSSGEEESSDEEEDSDDEKMSSASESSVGKQNETTGDGPSQV